MTELSRMLALSLYVSVFSVYMYTLKGQRDFHQALKVNPDYLKSFNELKGLGSFFFTTWTYVLQIGFVATAILDETSNLLKLPKGIRHRLGTVRSFIFHSLLFPSTLLVMTFFWSLWHFDRSLIFPKVLDEFFPTWLNHALHTFIAVPLVIELCLSTRREFKEGGRAAIVLLGYMTVYTTLFLSLYFRYGIWLYPIYKFLTWPQKAVLCVVKFMAVLVFQRIGLSLMKSKRGTTDRIQKVQ